MRTDKIRKFTGAGKILNFIGPVVKEYKIGMWTDKIWNFTGAGTSSPKSE
jgi:hypothetical protein